MMNRTRLRHGIPGWVEPSNHWFVTLCCKERGANTLANPQQFGAISSALAFYERLLKLKVAGLVVMPDHLHLVAQFNPDPGMRRAVESLKRYLARQYGIHWQEGFFDHRIRSDKLIRETLVYMQMNPVRAGLVTDSKDWPYFWKDAKKAVSEKPPYPGRRGG
ncbi:MAG: REP-associated tyrosine transposase [Opitutia bacterium]